MEKPAKSKQGIFSGMILIWIFFVCESGLSSQQRPQIDPFYVQLLEKAQKSFLAKNYEEAIRQLEIAAFGLAQDKVLQAKAYVYLGLSHFYLKDIKKSEKFLRQAADIMGDEGFASLAIQESSLPDLEKLLVFFNIKPAQPPQPAEATPHQQQEKQGKPPPLQANPGPPQKTQKTVEKEPAKNAQKEPAKATPITLDNIKEGDIVPLEMVDTLPVVIKRVQADYPAAARSFRIEGTIIVNALISEKGAVIKTEIIKGIKGAFGFNQSAQSAVHQWKFEPASIKGIKVKVWMPIAIVFKKQE
jgi:TonB family protein